MVDREAGHPGAPALPVEVLEYAVHTGPATHEIGQRIDLVDVLVGALEVNAPRELERHLDTVFGG